MARAKVVKRRRRTPEQAEAEILDATEAFLAERPFRDLEVGELMDRIGFTRSSFYHYFRDRHDLVVRLIGRLGRELSTMNEIWFRGGDDPVGELRTGYEAIAKFWHKHGRVFRAIADAATQDAEVEKAHRRFVAPIIRGTAARIRQDIADAKIAPLDPELTATALVFMSERFLNEMLGKRQPADWRKAVDVLATIWERTLYGAKKSA